VLLISDDDTTFPGITAPTDDEGLGFDYKINHGWSRDVLGYLRQEPLGRSNHYNEICFPMIYQYNERFILPLYDIVDVWNEMPGDRDEKFGNLKTLISYFIVHPGKKLVSSKPVDRKGKDVQAVQTLEKDAFAFYNNNAALFSKEMEPSGFEWINNISARENILVFSRRGAKKEDLFVVVVNFANVPHKGYKIGVPRAGRYTEVFCSDAEKYDGFGFVNKNPVFSEEDECDGRNDSIRIRVAPLSVAVYKYSPAKK
jgi:1,4-alpha-glucan branching enzyme